MNSQHDTDWALSAKGNWWRREDDKVLVTGKGRDKQYWVMVDGSFLEDHYPDLGSAQSAADRAGK